MSNKINWTSEMQQFILDNYYMRSRKELTELFNKEFGVDFKVCSLKSYCDRHKLVNGRCGRFKAGQESYNKGKKMKPEVYDKIKDHLFKKGHIPPKQAPVGSEVLTSGGYLKVKIAYPNVWKPKHRLVWEQAYGPIPENCRIIFLDCDKTNCELSNLKMATHKASLHMNRYNMHFKDAALHEVATNIAELEIKKQDVIRKRKERNNGENKS